MDQPTATLIASIVTASGSTAVGVLALYFATRQNARTLEHQRRMAMEERLAEFRSALYVEILQLILYQGDNQEADARLTEDLEKLAARVAAFASDEVEGMFNAILHSGRMPKGDPDRVYERGERIGIQLDSLLFNVRQELQPAPLRPDRTRAGTLRLPWRPSRRSRQRR